MQIPFGSLREHTGKADGLIVIGFKRLTSFSAPCTTALDTYPRRLAPEANVDVQ